MEEGGRDVSKGMTDSDMMTDGTNRQRARGKRDGDAGSERQVCRGRDLRDCVNLNTHTHSHS